MIEGWHDDEYVVLFDESEAIGLTARYDIDTYLAGWVIVGLLGWDDFIVKGNDGRYATVPTVPLAKEHIAQLKFAIDTGRIVPDDRFRGRVKWYLTPLVFGGSPTDDENITWVSLEQHVELVKWWNDRYRRAR